VRFWVVPSVYVPVAVNCCVNPTGMVAFAGVTAIDVSAADATVSVVLPTTVPEVAEMVVVPVATAVARPPAAMVAVAVLDDAQVAEAVRFCVVPSVYVPVAVNCCVSPFATLGFAGVTAMDVSAAAATVSVVLPVMLPEVAEIVVVPVATAVARPPTAMVAVAVLDDAQVTVPVRFWVEPSVYVPVALNCCVSPFATLGFAGVTAIEVSAADATVSVVLPTTVPEVAEMVLVPAATVVARPPAAMVAVAVLDDAQVAEAVRFCVVPSVYVPVAANCCVRPFATLGFAGVTAMDVNVATTVSVLLPLTVPKVAEMMLVPDAELAAVARPVALMVATVMLEDAHVTLLVRSRVLASAYVPVAVNCCVAPVNTLGPAGVTAIDVSETTVSVVLPLMPSVAVMVVVPAAVAEAEARPAASMVTVGFEDPHVT
jgi:hypothetical protein